MSAIAAPGAWRRRPWLAALPELLVFPVAYPTVRARRTRRDDGPCALASLRGRITRIWYSPDPARVGTVR